MLNFHTAQSMVMSQPQQLSDNKSVGYHLMSQVLQSMSVGFYSSRAVSTGVV